MGAHDPRNERSAWPEYALERDEGDVGAANGVGGPRENESGVVSEDDAEAVTADVLLQAISDADRDAAVTGSRERFGEERSGLEFVPEAVVRHRLQVLQSPVTAGEPAAPCGDSTAGRPHVQRFRVSRRNGLCCGGEQSGEPRPSTPTVEFPHVL